MNYFSKIVELDSNLTKSKNRALKRAIKSSKDYFFLIENNCKILDNDVFNLFIDTYQKTGISALMWGKATPNRKIDLLKDPYVEYYTDFSPTFMFFTREAVLKVGLMDEKMPTNTYQELEYAKRIGEKGLSTPFGLFASPKDIDKYFKLKFSRDEFVNRPQMDEALNYWEDKDSEFTVTLIDRPKIMESKVTEMI